MRRVRRSQTARSRDHGASLVEFALLLPLLMLVVLGIAEFGFILGQFNEVRHGAHEGARLAAVDDVTLGSNTCDAMQLSTAVNVDFEFDSGGSSGVIGDQASVTVTVPAVGSLSGLSLIEVFLPSTLSTTADFRLEQDSSNWDDTNQDQTPCP